ncbi:MAG TPA: hypothetical protein VI385_04705 [Flavisolibacter sp.]
MARQKFRSRQKIKAIAAPREEVQVLPVPDVKQPSVELIRFDLKAKVFVFGLIGLYFLLSLLKVHTSSIGNWDIMTGKPEVETVIAGKPRYIRVDEWMVATPAIIGQYRDGMPLSNPADGAGNVPVVYGFPVKDVSSLLRPAQWSYFIFDVERAFAFSWNFGIFFFLISTFLLFMLLTGSNFWVSVTGTIFIFLSSAVQWWTYTIAAEMTYLNAVLISFVYLLYSKKALSLILSGILLLFGVSGIFFNLYPPFQIPLIYLYSLVFLGFLIKYKQFQSIRVNLPIKVGVLSVVVLLFAVSAYHYYTITKDTYDLVLNTVYPGRRFSTGGDLIKGKFFSEFFGMYMSDSNVPSQWINICEESNFIMFFPIVFYVIAARYVKCKKVDPVLLAVSVFVLIGSVYVLAGFPSFLSKVTLLSMSPASRALPILGVGNAILLFVFLGNREGDALEKFTWIEFGILAVGTFLFVKTICSNTADATDNFFSTEQITTASVLIAASYLLIRYKAFRFITPIACLFLLGLNIANAGVHPISSGLTSLLEHPLVEKTKPLYEKDPKARWVVFGNQQLEGSNWANLLKVNGIDVFNGVKWIPPLKEMATLDSKADSVYNRFAHIDMHMFINGRDTVAFQGLGPDGYAIHMDPCSPRLAKLGVRYFVFTYRPQAIEVRSMSPIDTSGQFFIYKRNDQ